MPVTPEADWDQIAYKPNTLAGYGVSAADATLTAAIAAAISALGLGTAAQHAAADFATPTSVAAAISALGLGTAAQHAAADFATPTSVAAAISAQKSPALLMGTSGAAPGAVTLTGAKVAGVIHKVFDLTTLTDVTADFEATISVVNQIQQTTGTAADAVLVFLSQ